MKTKSYKCNKCGKIVKRNPLVGGDGKIRKTPRKWMTSWCEELGKKTRLYLGRCRKPICFQRMG